MNAIIVLSVIFTLALVVIAASAIASFLSVKNSQARTEDLYRAIIISTLMKNPEFRSATARFIKLFKKLYTGRTPIFREDA